MQHDMDYSSQGCDNFVLITSTKKTEVMYQAAPEKPYQEKHITVNGQNLQAVDNFTYLGSTLSRVVYIDAELWTVWTQESFQKVEFDRPGERSPE